MDKTELMKNLRKFVDEMDDALFTIGSIDMGEDINEMIDEYLKDEIKIIVDHGTNILNSL